MNKDINFNISLESARQLLKKLTAFSRRYVVFVFATFVLIIYGFLVYRISTLGNIGPNEDKITEEKQVIKRPQIDEETIQKIERLEDQNIAVQSLFKAARENPFRD